MSQARWCDFGDHAFKAGREGTVMMGIMTKTDPGKQPEQDVQEMCPECAASVGVNLNYKAPESPETRRKELLAEAEKIK